MQVKYYVNAVTNHGYSSAKDIVNMHKEVSVMNTFMIDMCSIDIIAKDDEFSALLKQHNRTGKIRLLTTDVLEEQYRHPKVPRNSRELLSALIFERVEAEAFIWGFHWGAKWGDGSHTGMSVDSIMTANRNHIEDALIAVTGVGNADVLVTEDERLRKNEKFAI